jgi:hypothetical protein
MACLAGARESFARPGLLTELAGWRLDDEAVRLLYHAEAAHARAWQADAAPAAERLGRAAGGWEESWRCKRLISVPEIGPPGYGLAVRKVDDCPTQPIPEQLPAPSGPFRRRHRP